MQRADRHDRELDDIFAVQDEVTERIIEALQSRLQGKADIRRERQTPQSIEAYDCVLRAIEYSQRVTQEANGDVRAFCERAIALLIDREWIRVTPKPTRDWPTLMFKIGTKVGISAKKTRWIAPYGAPHC